MEILRGRIGNPATSMDDTRQDGDFTLAVDTPWEWNNPLGI
jgi:hypothetical protein